MARGEGKGPPGPKRRRKPGEQSSRAPQTVELPHVDVIAALVNADQAVVREQLGLAAGGDLEARAVALEGAWGLTRRQRQVLELVAVGLSNKAIGAKLGCAQVTVELHMTRLLARSRCENRAMLVARFWTFPMPPAIGMSRCVAILARVFVGDRSRRSSTKPRIKVDDPTADDLSSLREILDELDDSGDIDEGLEAALDSIGSAAFVLGADGAVRHANAFGRTLLAADRDAVTEELRSSLASASTGVTAGSSTRYWVSQLARSGEPQYVALIRAMPGDPGPRLRIIASAWGLTSRQTTVLGLVAQGLANKTISAYLNCAEVTVELHMTALLARSGAASRAELVARFWTFPLA